MSILEETLKMTTKPPSVFETAFNCPHCHALAMQTWHFVYADRISKTNEPPNNSYDSLWDFTHKPLEITKSFQTFTIAHVPGLHITLCANCHKISIWKGDNLISPIANTAPQANPDTPENILADYNEASAVLDISPRSAAALLRLCIQKLCGELGEEGKNINKDIASLVEKGLNPRIKKALDAVRVTGNNAVHPGKMDLVDDHETVISLFKLFNVIVEKLISEPKHIDDVYDALPQGALDAINKRDSGS